MTMHTTRSIARRATSLAAGGASRALLVLALGAASVPLHGCGVSVLGRRVDLLHSTPKPEQGGDADDLRSAREQATLAPNEPYWPYRVGQIRLADDSLALAEAAFGEALRRDPTYAPALSLLSKRYYESGRHEEAVRLLEAARAKAGAGLSPPLLAGLALHYDALGQNERADALLATLPRSTKDGTGEAAVYLTLRGAAPDSATELAKDVFHANSKSAADQNNYAITRLRAGDPIAARKAFLAAIDRDPNLPGPYYNLAILEMYYLFDDAAAKAWFEKYWSRSTQDPDGLAVVFGKREPKTLAENGSER